MDREAINRKAREDYHRRRAADPEGTRKQNTERTNKSREKNRDMHVRAQRNHYVRNREAVLQANREYYEANKKTILARKRAYAKKRRAEDPTLRLTGTLRSRIGRIMRGEVRPGSAVRDLGCTAVELKAHLERLFKPGMTWDNYGRHGWHVDHVKPLSAFDLTDPAQFAAACHFTNLQPLWAEDNLKKGAKYETVAYG